VVSGSVSDLGEPLGRPSCGSPNLWWPDDRAWVVSTEIDLDTSFLAGSSDCIRDIQQTVGIEAFQVSCHDPIAFDSDLLNRPYQ
jgi:hypothetical protein